MNNIKKAIIPVAGFGTRFLPATKAQPKSMFPLVDKPIIQVLVEEAVASGIEQIIFITNHSKRAIEDHFDRNFELEWRLREGKKDSYLEAVVALNELAKFVFVRQPNPNGDGHAILQARELIGPDEPVAVFYEDNLYYCDRPAMAQLMSVYEKYGDPVVGLWDVGPERARRFGIAKGQMIGDRLMEINGYVEKPAPGTEPSTLAGMGRYIVTPELMDILSREKGGKDGEIRLADAFKTYAETNRAVYGWAIEGDHYDCGDKLEYAMATVNAAIHHQGINKDGAFTEYLKRRVREL